jgi:hypothetical protein
MKRKNLGKGLGKGYKNILNTDSAIHSMSARGVKQKQVGNPVPSKSKIKPNLYRVYSSYGDEGNADRREDMRILAHDMEEVLDYLETKFKKRYRKDLIVDGDDDYSYMQKHFADGSYEGYEIQKDNEAEKEFKTIYGTNDFVDLTGKKPKKAPDHDPELSKAWKQDPQKGADLLTKKTLQKFNEEYKPRRGK